MHLFPLHVISKDRAMPICIVPWNTCVSIASLLSTPRSSPALSGTRGFVSQALGSRPLPFTPYGKKAYNMTIECTRRKTSSAILLSISGQGHHDLLSSPSIGMYHARVAILFSDYLVSLTVSGTHKNSTHFFHGNLCLLTALSYTLPNLMVNVGILVF